MYESTCWIFHDFHQYSAPVYSDERLLLRVDVGHSIANENAQVEALYLSCTNVSKEKSNQFCYVWYKANKQKIISVGFLNFLFQGWRTCFKSFCNSFTASRCNISSLCNISSSCRSWFSCSSSFCIMYMSCDVNISLEIKRIIL